MMLCERGIRTFETAYRFTLDLTAIPVLKELTHLPVIVDPSHAAGPPRPRRAARRSRPPPSGADGIIVEVAPRARARRSATARSSCAPTTFAAYAQKVEQAAGAGRQAALRRQAPAPPGRVTDVRSARRGPRGSGSSAGRSALAARAPARRRSVVGWDAGRPARARGAARRAAGARRGVPTTARGGAPAPTSWSSPRPLARLARGRSSGPAPRAAPDCVVTDVGSTKRAIVAAVATTSASSAATRSPAPRRRASSTPARTSSTARPGT